jgi:hypothetical protein
MNANANLLENISAVSPIKQRQKCRIEQRVISVVFPRSVQLGHAVSQSNSWSRRGFRLPTAGQEQFWENLGYVTLLVCALVAIGVCFLV